MKLKGRILIGLAFLMFILGLAYGVLMDGLPESSAADTGDQSHFGNNPDPAQPPTGNSNACLTDPSVIEELQSQRDNIAAARKELAAKEEELKEREQVISEEMKKLDLIRDEITKKENLGKKDAEDKIAKLIETFESMSPKNAAKVITELDDVLAVAVVARMDTDKLAKIMSQLDPKRASKLNEMFAGVARPRPVAFAAAEPKATNSKQEGGDKNDGKNISSTNDSNGRAARGESSERRPSSTGSPDSTAVAGAKTPGTGSTKVQ